jgi:hypothetical protein
MFPISTDGLSTLATSLARFLRGKLMRVPSHMGYFSASARYLSLFLWIHRGKASRLFARFLLYISHVGLLTKCVRSQMWTQGT